LLLNKWRTGARAALAVAAAVGAVDMWVIRRIIHMSTAQTVTCQVRADESPPGAAVAGSDRTRR
jgi:hypothetical protein